MNKYKAKKEEQMELIKEGEITTKAVVAKRVNIISLKMVRENSFLYPERRVRSSEDAFNLVKKFLVDSDREYFLVACLDTKNQPTAINICHVGSLNASIVHPREVMKPAILSNSASIIVAHNHPSSDPTPSREDIEVTKRLVKAGEVVGIAVLDHLIVGIDRYVSLKEKGYI
ncbi:RadC family protein [Bacillus sp. WLY-B-L8]|uniref:RadC family protein n=1 Tax=Bacillus multifaciens TaxID=3068506 RepID=UPI0027411AF0|nr:DNA repair protein RadC [Bacillus sp. WLY-B-L8]MDP7979910.1 DNA repair protein RadC [Bacillus sp. WLY-B-L8]